MKLKEYLPEIPSFVQTEQRMIQLANTLNVSKAGQTYRANTFGTDTSFVNSWLRQQMAYRQQMINDLRTIAMTVEEIRAPIGHITSEVFRHDFVWVPKFAVRCPACRTEYAEVIKECKRCGFSGDFDEPDESQKNRPDKFLGDCNIWDQSLEEVLRQFHFTLNALDDAYLYIAKEYYAEDGDEQVKSRVTEIRCLDPAAVELDLDEQGLPKNAHFFCYLHRDESFDTTPGKCEMCGRNRVPAMYKYLHRGETMFLFDSEVVHLKKFHTDETYGWSPILTIFEKVMSIKGMDSFLYRYFFERKMPSSMVMVFTDDPESLRRERENIAAKMKLDPHYVPMVAVSSRQSRGRVDMVRLFHTLHEMDYLPVIQEIRERIASMWGVTPIWQGAPDEFGGLSSQTTQLTVMSRVVEGDQKLIGKVLLHVLEAFGVTDWVWKLPQPEEKAEATRLQFSSQKISAANMLFSMGFDVKIKSAQTGIMDIDFVVSGEAKQQDMFGGGFGGGMGGFGGYDDAGYGGGEGGSPGGQEEQSMQFMQKAGTFVGQIIDAGYPFPAIHNVTPSGDAVMFSHNRQPFIAKFTAGKLVEVEKVVKPSLHRHGTYPPHPQDMPHKDNRAERRDESFMPEMPDEIEEL